MILNLNFNHMTNKWWLSVECSETIPKDLSENIIKTLKLSKWSNFESPTMAIQSVSDFADGVHVFEPHVAFEVRYQI